MREEHTGRHFQRFTKLVVFFAILLIWWGAATTTKLAGMAFSDWPLSLGSINPPGWLSYMIPFLEHSHRLLATLVGVLVLAMFSWAYAHSLKRSLEVVGLVIGLAVIFAIYIMAGAERFDADRKLMFLELAVGLSLLPIIWLVWSWKKRSWFLLEKLCALALLMVTTQAILGGLRVTEISNTFAVIHGCLAQAFFCLLILIVMVAGDGWKTGGFLVDAAKQKLVRLSGLFLVFLISMQLVFGASMRHFHRVGLADTDIVTTQGALIPSFEEPIIAVLFLHKWTAVCILLFAVGLFLRFAGSTFEKGIKKYLGWIVGILFVQLILGICVIATGKHFWITNIHVINGLAILALAFVFVVKSIRATTAEAA